jgi:hypothetical protein
VSLVGRTIGEARSFISANHCNDESIVESEEYIVDTGKRTNIAIKETTNTYLRNFGFNLDLEQIEQSIRDRPLPFVAMAAAAGFVMGGGMAIRPAVAIFALLGRKAAKETATNFITGLVTARPR